MTLRRGRRLFTVMILSWPGAALGQATVADDGGVTAEEARLEQARDALPGLELDPAQLTRAVQARTGREARVAAARTAGLALWRAQRRAVQGGVPDDRPLYWQRLAASRHWRQACAGGAECRAVLQAFELASRGIADLAFDDAAGLRIAVSGFDPFNLDEQVVQSNPSGLAALALDGVSFAAVERRAAGERGAAGGQGAAAARRVVVETVMLPVRFADFDAGLVESIFAPLLTAGALDALVTVSMGRDGFDLERFPGRRRSAAAPDNLGVRTGASEERPLVPSLAGAPLPGPEFVEFSLPAAELLDIQQPFAVRDNHEVTTLERGTFAARSLAELDGQTAVRGSGGGYLSNEVSYRTVRLVRQAGGDVVVGHIHTPRVAGYDVQTETAIVAQVRRMVERTALALAADREIERESR